MTPKQLIAQLQKLPKRYQNRNISVIVSFSNATYPGMIDAVSTDNDGVMRFAYLSIQVDDK